MPARFSLLVVLSVVYIDMLGIGLAFPVLPRLIEEFEGGDVSRASYIYGALAAAYALMQFLFAPLLGALSDRYGRRPVPLLALVGMAINYLLLAFAPTLALFAVGRMIAGAFGATFTAAGAPSIGVMPIRSAPCARSAATARRSGSLRSSRSRRSPIAWRR
jgi:DHA1 family tetracycline resistance protein-like MFS transporter